jgi:hypothetical protein
MTTLPHSCADCLEIWGLNLLETYGPVQVYNGIAVPLLNGTESLKILPASAAKYDYVTPLFATDFFFLHWKHSCSK